MTLKEICIVGTPHIRLDQGSNTFKQSYEKYIEESSIIIEKIAQFSPDLITIEWDTRESLRLKKEFKQIINQQLPHLLNEHHFIAMPLAHRLGLSEVLPIDFNQMQTRKIRASFADEYLENADEKLYQYMNNAKNKHQLSKNQPTTLYEKLTEHKEGPIPLEQVFAIRSLADSPGIAFALEWSERNHIMATNIIKAALNHERTIVFTGMSHVRFLEFIIESTGLFKVIPSQDILK
ncbi:DUF5694 domain-containing protein [Mammaliicoccus lentus]|uniref:DUF5694 domain-containing protein n=1 Tax=Mammaliicoccus lentus TaxID=42858 RepID=UPI001072E671|nr:DUF5694 domain-containing protein [Mammaliicoccus lentus]MBF0795461.1 hypothetical protein [Mammaliicoccus lentus]TFV14135.1 hypothetical protein E4T78_12395 [Mammaliicoccus lentus]